MKMMSTMVRAMRRLSNRLWVWSLASTRIEVMFPRIPKSPTIN